MITKSQILTALFAFILILGCRPDNSVEPETNNLINRIEANSVEIVSPTYGENWSPGSTNIIKWSFANEVEKVNILLYRKSALILEIASNIENENEFEWNIPGNLPRSHHYRVFVEECGSYSINDFSEYFYILEEEQDKIDDP
ncbi:MAG: Ser-Thr-rich GPI-anchored membrane family protein [Ignavibacteria bacterium]|jgi:hypothetical protein